MLLHEIEQLKAFIPQDLHYLTYYGEVAQDAGTQSIGILMSSTSPYHPFFDFHLFNTNVTIKELEEKAETQEREAIARFIKTGEKQAYKNHILQNCIKNLTRFNFNVFITYEKTELYYIVRQEQEELKKNQEFMGMFIEYTS